MKSFIVKSIIFITACSAAMIAILYFLPYSKAYGYNSIKGEDFNKVSWDHQRIFLSSKPIDIAVIGTSRTYYGVRDDLATDLLKNDDNTYDKIVNLAFPGLGRNQHYVVAEDLFSQKQPHSIIIEVMQREKRDSHRVAIRIAGNNQTPRFFMSLNFKTLNDLKGFYTSRKQHLHEKLFGSYRPTSSVGSEEIAKSYRSVDLTLTLKELEIAKKELDSVSKPPLLPERYWNLEYSFPLSMIKKICSEADRKNVKCYFLYIGPYGAPDSPDPFFTEIYQELGHLLLPPPEIWNDPSNYCDSSHLNERGAQILTRWLSKEIAKNRR